MFEVLSDLRVLVLDSNHFTSFPSIITGLTGLEVLQFSRNKVVEMHEDIGSLVGLQELIMDSNELTEVGSNPGLSPNPDARPHGGGTGLSSAGTHTQPNPAGGRHAHPVRAA
jgi:hypothetical protein